MLNLSYYQLVRNAPAMRYGYLFNMLRTLTLVIICSLFCVLAGGLSAQVMEHKIFNDEIKSVRIHPLGDPLRMPIIGMGERIGVFFDDIGEYQRDLVYTIVHCNRDWTPSSISKFEYLDGFDDARLIDLTNSRGTYVDYSMHALVLPNSDIQWKLSGNYILKIWDEDNDDELLMQLRFVVSETNIDFTQAEVFRSTRQGYFDSHQEVSFAIGIKDKGLDDPMRSLSATVIQNYDWNMMIDSIVPRRIMREEVFFDQHNAVVFPSMREYRLADLRTLSASSFGVHQVNAYQDGINVTMTTNEVRGYQEKFGNDWDLNGGFVIDMSDATLQEWELEYVHAFFTLHYFNAPVDADVYLLGPFNNYTADENSKMEFEGSTSIFYKEILLKQGVYDFVYGVKEDEGPIDFRITEGYDNRANNHYNTIIYYRPFLGTYDRVISYNRIQR